MRTPEPASWHVVLPVKRATSSKTRLGGQDRARLAIAFATDTLRAALACDAVTGVVVVTEDPEFTELAISMGATVVAEPHPRAPRGFDQLNAAIRHGVVKAGLGQIPVAALTADLPALRPQELAAALSCASCHDRAFVADHLEVGTSLVTSLTGRSLDPRFGGESAAAHESSGRVRLRPHAPGLRQDVDLPADLHTARRLGCGPATLALLAKIEPGTST